MGRKLVGIVGSGAVLGLAFVASMLGTVVEVPVAASTPVHPAGASGSGSRVVAVGDIASVAGLDDRVAQLTADLNPEQLLLMGDVAYDTGSSADFANYFTPDWSRFANIWMPLPGNHEYRTANAAGYRSYFGRPTGGLYSTRTVGSWQVIALDSEKVSNKTQLKWLKSTLKKYNGKPTLVTWHRARYSSGEHGDMVDTSKLWNAVKNDADVKLVLWGHDHDYERMAVPVKGRAPVTAMVVGTGGGELRPTPAMVNRPWRAFYADQVTGVLDLRLAPTSFAWAFVDVDGNTLDSGTQAF